MTREEHLNWCKTRAIEYVEAGDLSNAQASMISDLGKHPDTIGHPAIETFIMMKAGGQLDTPVEMRKFIEGFH